MVKDVAYYIRRARRSDYDTNRICQMLANIRQFEARGSEALQLEYLKGLDYMKRPICPN